MPGGAPAGRPPLPTLRRGRQAGKPAPGSRRRRVISGRVMIFEETLSARSEWMGCTGLQEREGEGAVPDPVLVLEHDPRVGDVIDQHEDDEISGELRGAVAPHAPAARARDRGPHHEVHERVQDVADEPDHQRCAVLQHHGERGLELLGVQPREAAHPGPPLAVPLLRPLGEHLLDHFFDWWVFHREVHHGQIGEQPLGDPCGQVLGDPQRGQPLLAGNHLAVGRRDRRCSPAAARRSSCAR